jgi:hypothetical protein
MASPKRSHVVCAVVQSRNALPRNNLPFRHVYYLIQYFLNNCISNQSMPRCDL